jgi:sugar phosphate isomerase/epimerase
MQISHVAINADAEMIDGRLSVLRRALSICHKAGFTAVELGAHGLGVLDNGTLNEKRMKEVMAVLMDFPFQYLVHGPNPLNLMDLEQSDLERRIFGATLELTARVGSPLMVYHAGRYLPEEQFLLRGRTQLDDARRLRMWELEKLRLRELGAIAVRHGVVIAVENARPYLDRPYYCYGESLQDLATMIEEVNHPNVRATLDIGHAFLAAKHYQNDLLSEVETLAPYVCHVHMHDNHGRCCASFERKQTELAVMGRGDLHMPPGWGSISFADVFSKLPGYRGAVTIELRPRYREHLPEALENALEFLSPHERCA